MFGYRVPRGDQEDDAQPDEPEPDYGPLVERELRIAHCAEWAEKLWREILSHYAPESRRQRYVYPPRRPR